MNRLEKIALAGLFMAFITSANAEPPQETEAQNKNAESCRIVKPNPATRDFDTVWRNKDCMPPGYYNERICATAQNGQVACVELPIHALK